MARSTSADTWLTEESHSPVLPNKPGRASLVKAALESSQIQINAIRTLSDEVVDLEMRLQHKEEAVVAADAAWKALNEENNAAKKQYEATNAVLRDEVQQQKEIVESLINKMLLIQRRINIEKQIGAAHLEELRAEKAENDQSRVTMQELLVANKGLKGKVANLMAVHTDHSGVISVFHSQVSELKSEIERLKQQYTVIASCTICCDDVRCGMTNCGNMACSLLCKDCLAVQQESGSCYYCQTAL